MVIVDKVVKLAEMLGNQLNAALGRKQKLIELIDNSDLTRLKSRLDNHDERVCNALKEYIPENHKVMLRKDKKRKGKPDKIVAKLPIPFQKVINLQATAFLFGEPVVFSNHSDDKNTEEAFNLFRQILEETRFNSTIRECKTIAGSETLCAKLYHLYLDGNDVKVKTKVLSKSHGDSLYFKKDEYGKLIMFARGYEVKNDNGVNEPHFDVYTDETIYRGKRSGVGWEKTIEVNFIGKIPVIIYEQPVEWDGVQPLIERREEVQCKDADVNDYFADPKLVCSGIVEGLPDPDDIGAVMQMENGGKAGYLTYDSAPENRKNEYNSLERLIYGMTFSADISFDSIKNMTIPSGEAWKYVFMAPLLKAKNQQDRYGELISREINLIKAVMKVMSPEMAVNDNNPIDNLDISFEFSTPMPNDTKDRLEEIARSIEAGILSQYTGVRTNPLVKNPDQEYKLIKREEEILEQRRTARIGEPTY